MKISLMRRVAIALMAAVLSLVPYSSRQVAASTSVKSAALHGAAGAGALLSKFKIRCVPGLEPQCAVATAGAAGSSVRALALPARMPVTATTAVVPAVCPDTTLGGVCGTVAVPLDRAHPTNGTIPIFFELFTHTAPSPAQSAILVNFGGPGVGTVPSAPDALRFFSANLDVHDLLLIDDRGRGLSGTINCPALQHGTEPFSQAETECAAQLGSTASFYGTGDIAQDTDAVRAALGYNKVDYVGMSAGGQDVAAYATRYPSHVRSIVQDAPYGPAGLGPFTMLQYRAQSETRIVSTLCGYSPTCSADHPFATADLGWLINYIRFHPVEGNAYDANGNLQHVRIDETYLPWYLFQSPDGIFTSTGELTAAATSLRQGDPAPLLRLGAETYFPSPGGDNGDPTGWSQGAHYATGCVDNTEPWNWQAPLSIRFAQYLSAVAQLPETYFAPFSKLAASSLEFGQFDAQCLWWQKPTPSAPVTLPGAIYPNVSTLILDGDIDNQVPLEETTRVAALYPGHILVPVADSYHTTLYQTTCAVTIASRFIETLQTGDLSCARTPEVTWPAVGRFPVLAADAVPAAVDFTANNQIGLRDRKAVTVAVAAAIDTLQRSILGSGNDQCLRAGSFHTDFNVPVQNAWTVTLNQCSFSRDLAASGTLVIGADNAVTADLTLSGPGTAGGAIHVSGFWLVPGPVGNFKVSGTLGGLNVGVLVPEA